MSQKKPINRIAIGVGALCVVLLIALAYSVVNYTSMLQDKDRQIQYWIDLYNGKSSTSPDTSNKDAIIADLRNRLAQKDNEIDSLKAPNLISVNMKYEDNRPFLQDAYMRVYGYVVNVGTNTANNAKIHVVIYQGATVAKDTTISLGSISGESYTSVDTKVYYTGSAITTYSANLEFT